MKKRLWMFVALVLIISMVISACAPKPTATPVPKATAVATAKPAPTEAVEEEVVLEFWQHESGTKLAGMEAVVGGFQEKYPNITVNMGQVPYEEYLAKLAATVPVGTGPDVLMMYYGWAPLWEKSGLIAPLADEVQQVLNEEFAPFVEITKLEGEHYCVPTSIRNSALLYNVNILKEAGWDKPPDTWDEFLQCAIDCTKYDAAGNITQAGYFNEWGSDGWNWWRACIDAFGGQTFSEDGRTALFNEGKARDAFQFIVDLDLKHKVGSPGFYEAENSAFAAGLSAMTIQLTYVLGYLRENAAPDLEWAVTLMPEGPAGRFSVGSSWPLGMTTKALNDPGVTDAATKFLLFMASEEGQTLYCDQTGELPSRTDMLGFPKYTEDPVIAPFMEQLPQTFGAYWCDEMAERQCCIDMFDSVVVGGTDAMWALDNGAACAQRVRDEFFED